MMDPKLLQPQDFRPTGNSGRRPRKGSNRRASSGAGAAANAAAVAPGRVGAVGVPGQYMQPVSLSLRVVCNGFVQCCRGSCLVSALILLDNAEDKGRPVVVVANTFCLINVVAIHLVWLLSALVDW